PRFAGTEGTSFTASCTVGDGGISQVAARACFSLKSAKTSCCFWPRSSSRTGRCHTASSLRSCAATASPRRHITSRTAYRNRCVFGTSSKNTQTPARRCMSSTFSDLAATALIDALVAEPDSGRYLVTSVHGEDLLETFRAVLARAEDERTFAPRDGEPT